MLIKSFINKLYLDSIKEKSYELSKCKNQRMNQLKIEQDSLPLTSNRSSVLYQSMNEGHKSIVNTVMSTNIMESFDQDNKTIKSNFSKDKIYINKPRSRDPRHEAQKKMIQLQKIDSLWERSKQAQHFLSHHVSIRNCQRQLQISYRQMRKFKDEYEKYGRIRHPNQYKSIRGGTAPKKMEEMNLIRNLVRDMVNENCSITLKGIKKQLQKRGISKQLSTLSMYMKDINYTRKKIRDIPIERNTKDKIIWRQNYCKMISKIPLQNLVFLDETSFHQNTNPKFGWAPKGLKPSIHVSNQKKKWVTLLAAVSIRGFQAIKIIKGPLNHTHICQFLEHYLEHLEPHEVLIFDNARIHHAAAVKEKIAQLNRPVRYLPAYTPQLNPIQNIFAQIKAKFLSQRQEREMSSQQVEELIKESVKLMQGRTFENYFRNYERWVEKGINGQVFD